MFINTVLTGIVVVVREIGLTCIDKAEVVLELEMGMRTIFLLGSHGFYFVKVGGGSRIFVRETSTMFTVIAIFKGKEYELLN